MDILAQKLGMDPAELRLKNFIKAEQFPYHSALGWEYDSGDYHTAMRKMMETVDYAGLRKEQTEQRAAFKRGETREIMGLGVSFFTEIVGAGPSKNCDILGIAMFDSCEIRLHPTGAGIARVGSKSQGQGHETTWAQIIATEIGIPADDIMVEEGNTDTAPYGLGTYGSRSTPVAGAAIAMAARKIKAKAQMIAAYKLEVHEDDLEWDIDGFRVKGLPEKTMSMKDICWAAYNSVPPGMEPGLEAVSYYDPPNMTYPFGAYICVMDIDVDTGVYKVRRFYALDDCGTRINPMIIEGQVHGGLTEAFAIAMGQEIRYDARATWSPARSWISSCRPRSRRRTGRPTSRSRRRRITRSAPRVSARARMSAACRRSPTPSTTPSRSSAPPTSRCRMITGATGRRRRIWEWWRSG